MFLLSRPLRWPFWWLLSPSPRGGRTVLRQSRGISSGRGSAESGEDGGDGIRFKEVFRSGGNVTHRVVSSTLLTIVGSVCLCVLWNEGGTEDREQRKEGREGPGEAAGATRGVGELGKEGDAWAQQLTKYTPNQQKKLATVGCCSVRLPGGLLEIYSGDSDTFVDGEGNQVRRTNCGYLVLTGCHRIWRQ